VAGTPLDFRIPQFIGARIDADDESIRYGNYVVNGATGTVRPCARVDDPRSGRGMEGAHQRARRAVLHREQPGRDDPWQGGQGVRSALGVLS